MEPAEILASASGQDTASVCIDPQLTSSWIPDNPQIHGFENFPREFGVRYEPLRKLADAPELPTLKHHAPKKDAEKTNILSMTVKNIENDDEMSVYATAGHSGVLIISVEPGTEAERIGLQKNDVIIAWGSAEICTVSDLKNCAFDGSGVTILRKQQKVILK